MIQKNKIADHEIAGSYLKIWQKTVDLLSRIMDVPAALIMRGHQYTIAVLVTSDSDGNPYHPGEKAILHTGLYCETVMEQKGY